MAEVSRQRFLNWFSELAAIGRTETGWNRVAWTPLEVEAQHWFAAAAESVGLQVRRDGAGSVWAVTPDADDGPWTCAGLAPRHAAGRRRLRRRARRGLCARGRGGDRSSRAWSGAGRSRSSSFVDEEGARFRTACFASLAITGRLDVDEALAAMDGAEAIHGVTRESLHPEPRAARARRVVPRGARRAGQGARRSRPRAGRRRRAHAAPALAGRLHGRVGSRRDAANGRPARRARRGRAASSLAVSEEARRAPARRRHGRPARDRSRLDELDPRAGRVPLDVRAREAGTIDDLVGALRGRFPEAAFTRESRNDGAAFDADLREALHAGAEAARHPRRRSALIRRARRGHPRAARPGGDALRPQPDRREPHPGRVRLRRRLRRGRPGARRRARSPSHSRIGGLWRSVWKSRKSCGSCAPRGTTLAHIATSGLWETRAPLDACVWKG